MDKKLLRAYENRNCDCLDRNLPERDDLAQGVIVFP